MSSTYPLYLNRVTLAVTVVTAPQPILHDVGGEKDFMVVKFRGRTFPDPRLTVARAPESRRRSDTTISVHAIGALAKTLGKMNLQIMDRVILEGKLYSESWSSSSGKTITRIYVQAERIHLIPKPGHRLQPHETKMTKEEAARLRALEKDLGSWVLNSDAEKRLAELEKEASYDE